MLLAGVESLELDRDIIQAMGPLDRSDLFSSTFFYKSSHRGVSGTMVPAVPVVR
jgi:hypothetical protein